MLADLAGQCLWIAFETPLVRGELLGVVVDGRVHAGDFVGCEHRPKDEIAWEVEEVFFKLESAKLNISASYSEVLSANESLRLANLRYKSGIATQREVVNNQRDLTDSKVRYIVAVTNYNILLADLSRQTGLDNIKPCDIKVNEENPSHPENTLNLAESNLIPLCQL